MDGVSGTYNVGEPIAACFPTPPEGPVSSPCAVFLAEPVELRRDELHEQLPDHHRR
jgi:hypothetical protein